MVILVKLVEAGAAFLVLADVLALIFDSLFARLGGVVKRSNTLDKFSAGTGDLEVGLILHDFDAGVVAVDYGWLASGLRSSCEVGIFVCLAQILQNFGHAVLAVRDRHGVVRIYRHWIVVVG